MPNNNDVGYLLDTHVWLWLNTGSTELKKTTIQLIDSAAKEGKVYIPGICIWEVATLVAKKRIILQSPLAEWINDALMQKGVSLVDISADIMIESSQLPDGMHGDPADRLIVATSRIKRIPILTRDEKILNYANAGYIQALKV
jgi:PIN domain nuclease of toxin-antitoxin system